MAPRQFRNGRGQLNARVAFDRKTAQVRQDLPHTEAAVDMLSRCSPNSKFPLFELSPSLVSVFHLARVLT